MSSICKNLLCPSEIRVFANANSGSLRKSSLERACSHLNKIVPTRVIYTYSVDDMVREIKEVNRKADILPAICGGDGSVNVFLNLLYPGRIFGIIPMGTANVVAVELGINNNILNACKGLISYAVKKIDIGLCNNKKFLFTAGIGFDAETAASVSKSLKNYTGEFAYFVSALKTFFMLKPVKLNAESDGVSLDKGEFVIISNMRRYGGNLFFSPKARYDDGILNGVVLRRLTLKSLLRLLCFAMGKCQFPEEYAYNIEGKHFLFEAENVSSAVNWQVDGEVFGPSNKFDVSISDEKAAILIP